MGTEDKDSYTVLFDGQPIAWAPPGVEFFIPKVIKFLWHKSFYFFKG